MIEGRGWGLSMAVLIFGLEGKGGGELQNTEATGKLREQICRTSLASLEAVLSALTHVSRFMPEARLGKQLCSAFHAFLPIISTVAISFQPCQLGSVLQPIRLA